MARSRRASHARIDELSPTTTSVSRDRRGGRLRRCHRPEVAGAVRWTRRGAASTTWDVQPHARVLETDAHLEVLAAQGRVRREADADTGSTTTPST